MSRAAADEVVDEDDVEVVVEEGEGEGEAEEEVLVAAEVGSVEGKRDLGVVCVVVVGEESAPLKWGRKFGGLVKACLFDSMDIIGLGLA